MLERWRSMVLHLRVTDSGQTNPQPHGVDSEGKQFGPSCFCLMTTKSAQVNNGGFDLQVEAIHVYALMEGR